MKVRPFLAILLASFSVHAVARAGDVKWETLDAKGVKIKYFVQGSGEPVVLIHGLL
jgi:hypothetical protein